MSKLHSRPPGTIFGGGMWEMRHSFSQYVSGYSGTHYALNSKRSTYLCLLSAGIKGILYHAQTTDTS